MKFFKFSLTLFFIVLIGVAVAQIPPRPNPPRLVNDFANLLTPDQEQKLERRLVDFNDSTSNVICIVTVADLNGMDAKEYAYEIGDKWGVKDKKTNKNNGIVILIKPKNRTAGEVQFAIGYDIEAVIPDAIAMNIAEETMIPEFKKNDYYSGISKGLDVILPIVAKEISIKKFMGNEYGLGILVGIGAFFGLMILSILIRIFKN